MKKAIARIARRYGLDAVVLFGSRARGDAAPDSDLDLCVSAPRLGSRELALIEDLADATRADVDVCIFERIGPSLAGCVAREGVLLYGSRKTFDRLRAYALLRWQDSQGYISAAGRALDRFVG